MMKKGFLFLSVFLLTLIYSVASNAYTFTEDFNYGIYWRAYPVPMKVYADSDSDYQEVYNTTNSAMSEWESAAGINLWELASGRNTGTPTGNYIKWSDNFSSDTGYDSVSTLAVTIRYNDGSFFDKVVVILNGENQTLRQNYNGLLRKTILHEFGHTVGLGHTDEYAIMYPYSGSVSNLQQDDILGVQDVVSVNDYRSSTGYRANLGASEDIFSGCAEAIASTGNHKGQSYLNVLITVLSTLIMVIMLKLITHFIVSYVKEVPSRIFKR